jgi:hypothetical protein
MAICDKCSDTGEVKKPVSDYIRELDVKAGHADRPQYTTTFCTCRTGHAQARVDADQRFN